MAAAKNPKSFLRDATGLVREISAFDSFVSNFAVINIPLGLITFTSAEYIFPGGDAVYATLLATTLVIFPALVYTFLTWSMSRAGGDYIFVSRIIPTIIMQPALIAVWITYTGRDQPHVLKPYFRAIQQHLVVISPCPKSDARKKARLYELGA